MIVKKFNEAYGQKPPTSKHMQLMFDVFRKYADMVMNDKDVKQLLKVYPELKGVDNMKIGDYLVSIKIMKNE